MRKWNKGKIGNKYEMSAASVTSILFTNGGEKLKPTMKAEERSVSFH